MSDLLNIALAMVGLPDWPACYSWPFADLGANLA